MWYFARHCPGGLEEKASDAYGKLLSALSDARAKGDEDSHRELMAAYRTLACYTFSAHAVHGKSILDTTRTLEELGAKLRDRRFRPVVLGVVFFGVALVLQLLDAWLRADSGTGATASAGEQTATAVSTEGLRVSLLASCVPLLIPVAWGALGACTALAKRISDRLSAMSYEENRMQGLTARIFLGAALALVLDILVFVEGSPSSGDAASLGFGPIAGAFLAGLFVQHIYGALETMMRRVSKAISPQSPSSGSASSADGTAVRP